MYMYTYIHNTLNSFILHFRCSNTSIGKFCSCSNLTMPKIYSYDHCMTLVLKSDGSNEGIGFAAEYTTANNTAARLDLKNCRYVICIKPKDGLPLVHGGVRSYWNEISKFYF